MTPITFIDPLPQSEGMFYATNNPYQVSGPRGFTEFKFMEGTMDLFVRVDFPGVIKESVKIYVESSKKKAVFVFGDAPKELTHDSSDRELGTATGLVCDCCIISNVQCYLGDGVIRLILSKQRIDPNLPSTCSSGAAGMTAASPSLHHLIRGYNPEVAGGHPFAHLRGLIPQGCRGTDPLAHLRGLIPQGCRGTDPLAHLRGLIPQGCRGTDPLDPAFTGPVILPHPSVMEGSKSAYESKQLSDGSLFVRIDMPGVPNDQFTVAVDNDGGVTVSGRAPLAIYDSSGRVYKGKVAVVPQGYDDSQIKVFTKHGVIRLIIPPFEDLV